MIADGTRLRERVKLVDPLFGDEELHECALSDLHSLRCFFSHL